jgi:hypothetical protein
MKIATWNLGHTAGDPRGYRPPVGDVVLVVKYLEADVVILTEYAFDVAPGLPDALRKAGFDVAGGDKPPDYIKSCNYVLAVAAKPAVGFERVAVGEQPNDPNANTNGLLVTLENGTRVYGVRVPRWEGPTADAQLDADARWLLSQSFYDVAIGDMNITKSMQHQLAAECSKACVQMDPNTCWTTPGGGGGSIKDRAVCRNGSFRGARVFPTIAGVVRPLMRTWSDNKRTCPDTGVAVLSDHAALVVDWSP